jgi:hypothetical protein
MCVNQVRWNKKEWNKCSSEWNSDAILKELWRTTKNKWSQTGAGLLS